MFLSLNVFSRRLILGMMLTSSFLSMWLSNTATTAMMLPIANAILESLFGDLETLKRNCRSGQDAEGDILNGSVDDAVLFQCLITSVNDHGTATDVYVRKHVKRLTDVDTRVSCLTQSADVCL